MGDGTRVRGAHRLQVLMELPAPRKLAWAAPGWTTGSVQARPGVPVRLSLCAPTVKHSQTPGILTAKVGEVTLEPLHPADTHSSPDEGAGVPAASPTADPAAADLSPLLQVPASHTSVRLVSSPLIGSVVTVFSPSAVGTQRQGLPLLPETSRGDVH